MRAAISICFILLSVSIYSQNYVAGGVLAYHGNAYERCIADLNKALASPWSLSTELKAKAYFYRGMARIKLNAQSPRATILGDYPVATALNDLSRARSLDAQWANRSDEELNRILSEIRMKVEAEYTKALTMPGTQGRPIYSRTIDELHVYLDVRNDYSARVLLAKIYEAYGDVYFNMINEADQIRMQRQYLSHYSRAIAHYEEALRLQGGGSKEIFVSLQTLSNRVGDTEREQRYGSLATQIGG